MVGTLLLRGMIVGVIAGLLAFGFARVYGEPMVDRAIAFEEQKAAAANEPAEPEIVSRATQAGFGLFTGLIVYGAAVGGLFALAFAFVYGRVGRLGARSTAALLALAAFAAIVIVPGIKYPANPPAVGDPETIAYRTELFFAMLLISVASVAGAVALARKLWYGLGGWNASIVAGLAFVAVIAIANLALPTINEVPEDFSASVLWNFRTASIGIHLVLWAVIGLSFGALTERSVASGSGARLVAAAR